MPSAYTDGAICDAYSPVETVSTFDPPFIYGHQCNSAIITLFVPILVYSAIISIVSTFAIQLLVCTEGVSNNKRSLKLPLYLKSYVPTLLWIKYGMPHYAETFRLQSVDRQSAEASRTISTLRQDWLYFKADRFYAIIVEHFIL